MDEKLSTEQEGIAWEMTQEVTFEGVLWVQDDKIVKANRQFERIFNLSELDVVGMLWLDLVHPSSRDRVKLSIEKQERRLISHFGGIQLALQHPTTGEKIPVVMMGFCLYRANGTIEVLIKKLMREEISASASFTPTGWLKYVVEKWPNIAAILTAVGAACAFLWEKLLRS